MFYKKRSIKHLCAASCLMVALLLLHLLLPCFPASLTVNAEEGVTTGESEVTTGEPEVTTGEPEVTTAEPEVTTAEPEVTTAEPEVTTAEPEVTTAEPEVTTGEPEVTTGPALTVTSFDVTCDPGAKTAYLEGETFDPTGYKGIVRYSDGSQVELGPDQMTFSPDRPLIPSDKMIVFSCDLTNKVSGLAISVASAESLQIGGTFKTSYREGEENIDLTGIVIAVVYSDGQTVSVGLEDCLYTPTSESPVEGDLAAVTLSYTASSGSILTAQIPVTVMKAVEIEVRSLPDINFYEGRPLAFETADIDVYARFEGETDFVKVFNFDIPSAGDPLIPDGNGKATLKLTLGNAETDFTVEVCKIAENGFTVSGTPRDLYYGDPVDISGIVISASYEDGASFEITDYVAFEYPEIYQAGSSVTASFVGYPIDLSPVLKAHTGVIKIVKAPTKTEYNAGESFSPAGMLCAAEYDDGETVALAVTDLTVEANDPLTETDSFATVSWNGMSAQVTIKVYPARKIQRIEIAEAPDTVKYITGQALTIDGIKVLIHYVGETETEVADLADLVTLPELGSPVTNGMKSFTVRYKISDSVYYDAEQPIEVETKTAISISIVTKPNRTEYNEGSSFNPAGMVVNIVYNDGTMLPITTYSIDVDDTFLLTSNDPVQEKHLRITYAGFETSLTVTVRAKAVKSISLLTQPAKTVYRAGESFDPSGMKVVLNYIDSSVSPVILPESYYTYAPTGKLTASDSAIYVSFRGQTVKVDITVTGTGTVETTSGGSVTTAPDVTTAPGDETGTGPDETGTNPPDTQPGPEESSSYVDPGSVTRSPEDSSASEPGGTTSANEQTTGKSGTGTKKTVDTIMILWIGIIVLIAVALVLVIIYYKRHFT
ncbi:MAG: bacterial Ig-like domain-containing protein [Clostridiales bacterium]|nr:bacterial Ig-like domain-containing protein [Clostridiales bacterium]